MRARRTVLSIAVAGMFGALLVPGGAHAEPTVVGADLADDWGNNVDPTLAAIGDALGQELLYAAIQPSDDGGSVSFILGLKSLPASGGVPEITRYIWDMMVMKKSKPEGDLVELDGKFSNYSRGVCDPTSGQCPPPRDPGERPFFVRGDCVETPAAVTCTEIGILQGIFDPTAATVTVPVPIRLLLRLPAEADPASECPVTIAPGPDVLRTGGGPIVAAPSAFLSSGNGPLDDMILGFDDWDGSVTIC